MVGHDPRLQRVSAIPTSSLFSWPAAELWPVDAGLVLIVAILLDIVFGEYRWIFRFLPHPVVLVGRAAAFADRRLNRPTRGQRVLRARGIVMAVVLCGGAALAGYGVHRVLAHSARGWMAEAVIVSILIAGRSLFDHVLAVGHGLSRSLAEGRQAVSHIVGRDPRSLDRHGVARAAVESLAESFCDGVVAPMLWYLAAGLPGICCYKAANTLDSMVGFMSPAYRAFGWASARFDDLLNLIPARLSALLLVAAAAILPRGRAREALVTVWQDAGRHRSPNAGWPEAAMAGALGLALGGPRHYGDHVAEEPWLGEGRARLEVADIGHALSLYVVAGGLFAILVLLAEAALIIARVRW